MSFLIESATGVLRDVLLCRPLHYEWLATSDIARESIAAGIAFNHEKAKAQHAELVAVLTSADIKCHFVDPVPGLADLCWTRDSSQMTPWGPVITCLSSPERQDENRVLREYYESQSIPISKEVSVGNIEGGDIQIIRPGLLAIGYSSSRTSKAAASEFATWFEDEGWEIWLQPVKERFVHLDVTFNMAATDLAIVCEEATGEDLPRWLQQHGIRIIKVGLDEAEQLACNCLSLGNDRVVLAGQGFEVATQLRREGVEVTELDLDMFTLAGGGVHCLTQPLRRDPI